MPHYSLEPLEISPLVGWLIIAAVFALVALAVANNWNSSPWPTGRQFGYVASLKDNGAFPRFLMAPYSAPRMVAWFEENDSLPTNGVIVWSQNATPYLDRIIAIIAHGRWGVMAIDDTPLPEDLAKLEAFEKTTAADLMWQWRVKMLGVPADLVERPYRPKPSRPLN